MCGHLRNSLLLFAGMLVVCTSGFPQSAELDSLKALLKDASGNRKGHLLNEIGLRLTDEEALNYYEQAIAESTDSVILARAKSNKGVILHKLGRVQEAEMLLEEAIPTYERIPAADYYTESMYSVLGRIYTYTGRYSSAMNICYKHIAMVRKRGDSLGVVHALFELGVLSYKIRRNKEALRLYAKAIGYIKADKTVNFWFYLNSGLCHVELGSPEIGLEYCRRASFYTEGSELRLLHLDFAIGFAKLKVGQTEKARDMLSNSLKKSIALNDTRMQADNLLYIGKTWLADSMLDSAYHVLERAENLATTNRFKEILLDIYRSMIQVADERKNLYQLTAYQQKYIELKQDVYNIELEKEIASLEGDWYEHENKQTIDFQQLELDERNTAVSYQHWISITLYVIVLLVLSIIALYLRGLYLQWQSQRYLKNQVAARFKWLKRDSLFASNFGASSHSVESREVKERITLCCRQMEMLLSRCPKVAGNDSFLKYFDRIASIYKRRSSITRYVPPFPTKHG